VRHVSELGPGQFPARLNELPEPPSRIYVVGELPRGPCVGIVGTREATPEGVAFARQLACDLARRGVAIASGGAKGIDRAAHDGTLDAGGVGVVVAPSSYDRPYPAGHASLYERVLETGGAYVSLYREAVAPRTPQFFARNAVLVALSHVLVVVESRLVGGGRNAAKWARALGRPLLVVPGFPWSPMSAGCLAEIRAGARLLTRYRDVMDVLSSQGLHAIPSRRRQPAGTLPLFQDPGSDSVATSAGLTDADRVLNLLRSGPLHPDEICLRTGLPVPRLQQLLLTLTLGGALATHPAGRVYLVNTRKQ
jgi:DNA processing protein